MDDMEIKKLLTSYVEAEMALLSEEKLPGCDHVYSKAYKKRIRRLFWCEKYLGGRIRLGYAVRRVAVVAMIFLSLLMANEVSARGFGFSPWKYVTSFLGDSRMDVKTYIEPAGSSGNLNDRERSATTRDIPVKIPKRFGQISCIQDHRAVCVRWGDGEKGELLYSRVKLSDGMSVFSDGEYESKEKVAVMDYAGEYCVKGEETWLMWDDTSYNYMILATGVNNPKEILLDMAKSLY